MHSSHNLSRLIHSMTKGEQRIFRQQAKFQTGNKSYVKLYQMLRSKKTLDDDVAMKTLGLTGKHQAYYNLKNYLLRNLLKSMIHSYEIPEGEIAKKIIYVKILIEKGINAQAEKIILPLLAEVQKEERFLYGLELSMLYVKVKMGNGHQSGWEDIKWYRSEGMTLLNNWQEYESLFEDLQPYLGTFATIFGKEILFEMRETRKSGLFQEGKLALSARSRRCYWGLHYVSAMMEGEFQEALDSCKELLALYESHPFLKSDHYPEHVSILINSGRLQLTLGQRSECEATLAQVHSLPTGENPQEYRLQIGTLELHCAIATGNREKGMETAAEVEKILLPKQVSFPDDTVFPALYELAHYYLAFGEPEKALKCTLKLDRKIGSFRKSGSQWVRYPLRWAIRLLRLIIAFELDDEELVSSYYRSAYRFLYCRNWEESYCGQLIHTVYKIIHQPLLERNGFYDNEIEKLEVILQDQSKARTIIYFDGLTWLKGKRKGKTIAEMNRLALAKNELAQLQ